MYKIKFVFLLIVLFFNCNNSKELENKVDFEVEVIYGVSLLPDFKYNYDNTSGFCKSMRNGNKVVTHISNSSAYVFAVKSGELLEKINLNREGPSVIGNISKFDGAISLGEERLLYSCHLDNEIVSIDKDSVKLVKSFAGSDNVRLVSSYQNPPIVGESGYIFSTFSNPKSELTKEFSFVLVTENLNEVKQVVSFPSVYKDFFGGTPYLYWAAIAFDESSRRYVVSYPVDHRLYIYDIDFNLIDEVELFHEEVGEILPSSLPQDSEGYPEWQSDRDYYRRTNHFTSLSYMPSYGGFVRIARTYDEVEDKHKWLCIAYNEDFSGYKEFYLDNAYQVFNNFTTEEGMFILNEDRMIDERSVAVPFDVFRVVKSSN